MKPETSRRDVRMEGQLIKVCRLRAGFSYWPCWLASCWITTLPSASGALPGSPNVPSYIHGGQHTLLLPTLSKRQEPLWLGNARRDEEAQEGVKEEDADSASRARRDVQTLIRKWTSSKWDAVRTDACQVAQLVRMDEHDRVSQASSVATISYFPVRRESDGKLQAFGKRCQAVKRDPNSPVVIRGWLNKKDSSGLKLWKRRWFVLSDYCLFYYKDSREEPVLGSIPLPSYKILYCMPRECKNRKFTFKVVHQGMRSYYFSADTQEDMLGWVRALSQSATMETEGPMHRRCSSYQDFTQMGGSTESVMDLPKSPSNEEACPKPRHVSRTFSEPSHLSGGRIVTSNPEPRGGRSARQRNSSPSARTPSPWGPNREMDSFPFIPTTRSHLGSRSHTPAGRADIRPQGDSVSVPDTLYYAPASPKTEFRSAPPTPLPERWQNISKPAPVYGSVHHAGRRPLGKSYSAGIHADSLPPLPPSSRAAHAHHPPHRSHLSPPKSESTQMRPLESDADAVLTRLCGCDKLLQSLSVELAQLQMDKVDSVQCALEVLRLQLEDWGSRGPGSREEVLTQKVMLLEELVTIRARMCDVSLEMEVVWNQYERMESELCVFRSHLQHVCNFGMPQEQSQAQRELWMMEDILAGLKVNREHFCFLLGFRKHHMFESSGPHPGSPGSATEMPHVPPQNVEQEPPMRPPLPQELLESKNQDLGWPESSYDGIYADDPIHERAKNPADHLRVKAHKDASASQATSTKKMKMSEEEQMERMKRNQERMTNRKKPPVPSAAAKTQSSETQEESPSQAPFPLRVTRVVTAMLPSSLVARRVSVEDPPPEVQAPLTEQLCPPEHGNKSEPTKPQQHLVTKTSRPASGSSEIEADVSGEASAKTSSSDSREPSEAPRDGHSAEMKAVDGPSDMDPGLCMSPEQREAKLRRVERIRQQIIQSAITPVKHEGRLHDSSGKQKATSDQESNCQAKTFRSSLSCVPPRSPALGATSQVENRQKQLVDNAKRDIKFGSRTQHKSYNRAKIKRPPSPHHVTSVTLCQKDAGEDGRQPDGTEDVDGEHPSSDLRAKWFLSTNHRLEFAPPCDPDLDISAEEKAREEDQPDEASDSATMSSAVSQSLEKMKENHSLFYKIACDISISDTDITKNDGNSPEELVITEHELGSASDQRGKDGEANQPVVQNGGTKESEERNLGLNQNNSRTPSSSIHNGKRVGRTAYFQKAKVTVFRTSL
ncbi:pleckstrin homology domain-containing family A member 4 isoform 3-T3 [Syngnathus typhle]